METNIVNYRAAWWWRNVAFVVSLALLGAPVYFLWLKAHLLAMEAVGHTFPANQTLLAILALVYVPATYFLELAIPVVLRVVALVYSPLRVSLFVIAMEAEGAKREVEPAVLEILSNWAFTLPDRMLTSPLSQGKAVILAMYSSDKALRNWPALQEAYRATRTQPLPEVVDEPVDEDKAAEAAALEIVNRWKK